MGEDINNNHHQIILNILTIINYLQEGLQVHSSIQLVILNKLVNLIGSLGKLRVQGVIILILIPGIKEDLERWFISLLRMLLKTNNNLECIEVQVCKWKRLINRKLRVYWVKIPQNTHFSNTIAHHIWLLLLHLVKLVVKAITMISFQNNKIDYSIFKSF